MLENQPNNYHRELIADEPQKSYFAAFDIGSTGIKSDLILLSYGGEKSYLYRIDGNSSRINYDVTEGSIDGRKFKYMSPDQTKNLLSKLKGNWHKLYEGSAKELADTETIATTLTGFTQSLAVKYIDQTVILLDEPSLITKPNYAQIRTLEKYLGEDGAKKEISTIIKLLSLKNHPYLLEKLFGRSVDFSQLKFSTMLGALTSEIAGDNKHFSIPLTDLHGFGKKNFTFEEAEQMLNDLGFDNSQILINPSKFSREQHGNIFVINDFEAEISIINELRKSRKINNNAIVIGLSSVGKIVISSNMNTGFKGKFPNTEESYVTQRMGANALTKWGPLIFPDPQNIKAPNYKVINEILLTLANENSITQYLYFPEIHDENYMGTMYKKTGEKLIKVILDDIGNTNIHEKEAMILALAEGITFGLREKIENVSKLNNEEKLPVAFYGGLFDEQDGWKKVVQQSLPETDVSHLDIPNANSIAAYLSARNFDPSIPKIEIGSKRFENVEFHRDKEYQFWKTKKKEL
jgi:hypothetical protein